MRILPDRLSLAAELTAAAAIDSWPTNAYLRAQEVRGAPGAVEKNLRRFETVPCVACLRRAGEEHREGDRTIHAIGEDVYRYLILPGPDMLDVLS